MNDEDWIIERRDFLRLAGAALLGLSLGCGRMGAIRGPRAPLRFGIVTDSHYADAPQSGTRFYRESIAKMREAVARLRAEKAAFLAELGDIKDMAPGEPEARTLANLAAIEAEVEKFGGPTYHVLGNHDMDNLSKAQAVAGLTNTGIEAGRSYYAFSRGGIRFIVLDACYLEDGRDYDHGNFDYRETYVPPAEMAWLARELAAARQPVIVLAHQRLDGTGDVYTVNSPSVRAALEKSQKVLAVFMGHDHGGGYTIMHGIHYYTQKAIVEGSGAENNSYTIVDVDPLLNITVTGYRRAVSRDMHRTERGATAIVV